LRDSAAGFIISGKETELIGDEADVQIAGFDTADDHDNNSIG
jgi:hypothetical protein